MPFASRVATGGGDATYAAALSEVHHNFVDAGYGGSQAFDNDDGSAWFHIYSNVMWNADGFKTDYGGHDSLLHDNLIVVRTYDGQACINSGDFVPGHETRIFNQTCVLPPGGSSPRESPNVVAHVDQACFGPAPGRLVAHGNAYFTRDGNATAVCGDGSQVLIANMTPPFEAGSTSGTTPPGDVLIAWARELLGM